jgi:hypothetical protein
MFRNKAFYCKFSILIILMSGLLACATDDLAKMYDGDKRPDKEIAKILLPSSLEVAEVNNKSIKTPYNPGGFQTMGLLPGSYKIRIFYKEFWGAANAGAITVSDVFDFDMKLEAGKEYVFKHNGPSDLIDADIEKSVKDIKIWLYQSDTKIEYQSTNRVAYGNFIGEDKKLITKDGEVKNILQGNDVQGADNFNLKLTDTQADYFIENWKIVSHQPNTSTGFSATLFQHKETGEMVYAPRGTEAGFYQWGQTRMALT